MAEKQLIPGKIYKEEIFGQIPFIEEEGDFFRFAEISEFGYNVCDARKSEVIIKEDEVVLGYIESYMVGNNSKSPTYDPKKYSRITKVIDIINSDMREQNLESIKEARQILLNKHQTWPYIHEIVNNITKYREQMR